MNSPLFERRLQKVLFNKIASGFLHYIRRNDTTKQRHARTHTSRLILKILWTMLCNTAAMSARVKEEEKTTKRDVNESNAILFDFWSVHYAFFFTFFIIISEWVDDFLHCMPRFFRCCVQSRLSLANITDTVGKLYTFFVRSLVYL